MDSFGRVPQKLRISVTDRCNMRCLYCMPKNGVAWYPRREILSYEEIARLTRILAGLGVEKIRLTGGEPLVRPQIETLIGELSKIAGIKKLSMTTNGLLLGEKAAELKNAGLQSVNVSLDTLVPAKFKVMTGVDGLSLVRNSLQTARAAGFEVKINTVIIRGQNDDELEDFVELAEAEGCTVRFIEFMPLDGSRIWAPSLVVTKEEMIRRLSRVGRELVPLGNDLSDPARLYALRGGKGTIGFIPSMSEPFCSACDRVRLTSDGKFLSCLFETHSCDVKKLLRSGKSDREIADFIVDCYRCKPEGLVRIIKEKNLKPGLNLMNTIGG